MDKASIPRRRLRNLGAVGTPFASIGAAMETLCAAQSQEFDLAKWSLGSRTKGVDDAAVHEMFDRGGFLRTHVLRPTWHFVLPDDIVWMQELTGPRVQASTASAYRQLELDEAFRKKTNTIIKRVLRGGNHLTRKELGLVLASAGIDFDTRRLSFIVMHAELTGLIASGVIKGKQHTYALIEERASDARSLSADEALAELTRRYFSSHGPATLKDFSWWSSLKMGDIRRGVEMAGSSLVSEAVDGMTFWFEPGTSPRKSSVPRVHLMQPYDEYIVGCSESKKLLDASGAARKVDEESVFWSGVIFLDGQVAGGWKRRVVKDTIEIRATLVGRWNARQRQALGDEAARYSKYLGLPAELITARY